MEKTLRFFKKLIPRSVFDFFQPIYHWFLGYLGALIYGFPTKKLIVIGVTGTKGKTTTCNLIHHILNSAGHKTGLSTTVNFKIGEKEWKNDLKQTMPGRFFLQKLLSQMVKENCKYAVIETSSEGIIQYRHRFIDYNIAVFLNISPEHLERHKGFENYRSAKVDLFKKVAEKENSIGVYNLDDENVEHFLEPKIKNKYGYTILKSKVQVEKEKALEVKNIILNPNSTTFEIGNNKFQTNLIGEFNVYNTAAAIAIAMSQNIPIKKIQEALSSFKPVSGRMEIITAGQDFTVIVDYAHEPKSLEEVYKAVLSSKLKAKNSKLVCLLGSAGGGRDKWKRPKMGKIAAKYCDEIILTNEDPYDENPAQILDEIEAGFSQIQNPKYKIQKNYWKIIDRKEAIKKAISLAKKGDAVVLTGKGGEMWMCVADNRKIAWNERQIVEEELKKIPPAP